MSMPGDTVFNSGVSYWGGNLTRAVLNGTVPEWRLDDMATRIMAAYFLVGQDPETYPETNFNSWTTDEYGYKAFAPKANYGLVNQDVDVRGDHYKNIREVAAKSNVLLKNVDGALPLRKLKQIGIFGSDAGEAQYGPNGCNDRGCHNGTLAMGWGSGTASFPYLITPLEAIKRRAIKQGTVVQSVLNDYAYAQINATAKVASACLVFVAADAGEGYLEQDGNLGDRKNLTLWNAGDALINTVASNCNNTIVVVHAVGVVLYEEFIDHPNVTAVIFAGLPGQESGDAIVDVLYGDVNPSGKLPFTVGKKSEDYGVEPMYKPTTRTPQQDFSEGLFIDYRHFDKNDIEPRFEFGFGMSYTTFNYSRLSIKKVGEVSAYTPMTGKTDAVTKPATDFVVEDYLPPADFESYRLEKFIYPYINSTADVIVNSTYDMPEGAYDITPQPIPAAGGAPGGNPSLYETVYKVSVVITNTGSCAGEEVAQLYLETGLADDPIRVLRGFEKVALKKGESKTVTMTLARRDVMRWDVVSQDWVVTEGVKTVKVGASSRNLPLSGTLQ